MGNYRFNYQMLYNELDKQRKEKKLSWTKLGNELQIASSTLKRTKLSRPMETDGIRAMVAWLGLAPEDFVFSCYESSIPTAMKCLAVTKGMVRRFDKRALFSAVNNKRLENKLSWKEATKEIGNVSVSMLKNLAKGGRIGMDLAVSVTCWLGQSIEHFTYETTQ